ncbi:hypothetical protein CDV31_009145 [Fusarium ambrosium]|uniref:Uncharacterized protein n=1 Tax=Fusarium ambrosium TaxID=131363 RepID=A0A428TWD3_9HYPO|nr:hypothetical protein CDV31_009145 [Fusarium ambrosium]
METKSSQRDEEIGLSCMVSGYAWKRKMKDKTALDIKMSDMRRCWNNTPTGWLSSNNALGEVELIHPVQAPIGLADNEFHYLLDDEFHWRQRTDNGHSYRKPRDEAEEELQGHHQFPSTTNNSMESPQTQRGPGKRPTERCLRPPGEFLRCHNWEEDIRAAEPSTSEAGESDTNHSTTN